MSSTSTQAGVVIVGAGQAGSEVATSLRQQGYEGRVVLIGDEAHLPYRRPPLSKTFLAGEVSAESLSIKPKAIYDKQNIECRLGIGVERLDRSAKQLHLFDGDVVAYDKLVLATGGRPRHIAVPGADRPNLHYVRTIDDIVRLKQGFTPGARLVIVGGGYIGLEVASVGIGKGLQVTIIETASRVLARVVAPEVSAFYEKAHRSRGVVLHAGLGVKEFVGEQQIEQVVLSDGQSLPADIVVVGVGLIANMELAETSGLAVGNGIVVDAAARTSDPDIYAAGDCSFHENTFYGRSHRLESVPNAMEQARIVAAGIVGKAMSYSAVPWFWSDQFDLKLQMIGLSEGYDQVVVRGSFDTESFIAFYIKDGVLVSAEAVNRMQDFMVARQLVGERASVDSAALGAEDVPLKSLLRSAAAS